MQLLHPRLQKSSLLQRALTPLGFEPQPERWIFIIGCYNSGTTLLNEILASHPDIEGLPHEGVVLTESLPRPEEEGWTRMWHKCHDEMRIRPSEGPERAQRIKHQWSLYYASKANNLLEKSIANAVRIPYLQKYFRPAYFIYIVRDGYAVAEGIRRKANPGRWDNPKYQGEYPIDLCARQWRRSDEVVSAARSRAERFLYLQYEELTENPVQVVGQITEFLGLSSLPEDVLRGKWNINGYNEPIRNMNDRSLSRLSSGEMDRIESEAADTLRKYGYSGSGPLACGRNRRLWRLRA
jgi:hypothetical protein